MKHLALVLSRPSLVAGFSPGEWQALLTDARQARMVDRLRYTLASQAPDVALPAVIADVFDGTGRYVAYLQHRARFEVSQLSALALAADCPVVLLKGAAYLIEGIEASAGRGLGDIDILVPHASLADVERRLAASGWRFAEDLTEYDHAYYRDMAHELPPMRHFDRQFELDVHHGILQPTHRLTPDSARLMQESVALDTQPFFRLSRRDQILHSATHLFMSDELRGGLRDLHDIVLLCRQGEAEETAFWQRLLQRAVEQGLQRPLHYAMYCAQHGLALVIPQHTRGEFTALCPRTVGVRFAERLFLRRFFSRPTGRLASACRTLLFLRSHWIRMPPLMLLRHLARKVLSRNDR